MIRIIFLTCLLAFTLGCTYVDTLNTTNLTIHRIKIDGDEYHIKTSEEFIRLKIKDTTIFDTYYSGYDDILYCEVYKNRNNFTTTIAPINGKYVLLLQPTTIEKLKAKP